MYRISVLLCVWSCLSFGSHWSLMAQERNGQLDPAIEELRMKYEWRSMYLTYGPLADILNIVSSDSSDRLVNLRGGSSLSLLTSLLTRLASEGLSDRVAFIVINLDSIKAAYTSPTGNLGSVTPLPWSEQQTRELAIWCDQFLNVFGEVLRLHEEVSAGRIGIAAAWERVKDLQTNTLVAPRRLDGLIEAFRNMLDRREGELGELRHEEPETYTVLQEFKTVYDEEVTSQLRLWREYEMHLEHRRSVEGQLQAFTPQLDSVQRFIRAKALLEEGVG